MQKKEEFFSEKCLEKFSAMPLIWNSPFKIIFALNFFKKLKIRFEQQKNKFKINE